MAGCDFVFAIQQFLNAMDSGILPPYVSEMLKHAKWTYYDGVSSYHVCPPITIRHSPSPSRKSGSVIIEVVDYRDVTESDPSPVRHRVLLRPTAETFCGDVERLYCRQFHRRCHHP